MASPYFWLVFYFQMRLVFLLLAYIVYTYVFMNLELILITYARTKFN